MGTSNGPNTFLAGTAAGHGAPSGITGSLVSLAPARCSASPGSPLASQTEKVDHLTLRAIAPGCSHANVEMSSHHHSRTSSISSIAAIAPICAALLRDCRSSSITVALRQSRRLPRHSIPSHVGSTRLLGFFGRVDEDEGELLPLSSFFFFLLSSAAAGAGAGSESASTLAVMSSE